MNASFKERLLKIMDQKNHWGWRQLTGPNLHRRQLLVHFQQEYEVYVRDFPIMLARILGRMSADALNLKREFAENIFEEQTGGLSLAVSKGASHPELFLKMMKGLGFKDKDFEKIELLPTSLGYRSFLDLVTLTDDWRVGAALLTLWVEGSVEDRARLHKNYKPTQTLNQKLTGHSLHRHHGLKLSSMDLIRAHHLVEGSHRKSAWETVLNSIPKNLEDHVVETMQKALDLWLLFRDGVCLEMGLENQEYRSIAQAK